MTTLGKVLVFLNLFVAVALLTWAVSLSANRLDWLDRTDADGQKVEGEISKQAKEVATALKGITDVSAAYGRQERALADAESGIDPGREGRDRRRAVFASRLAAARNGQFREQRQIPGKVLIDVSQEGPPIRDANGAALEGVDLYQKRLNDYFRDSQAYRRQIDALRKEFDTLSTGPDGIEQTAARTAAQRVILENLGDEKRFLESVQVNWDEELRTLQKRRDQLTRRINNVRGGADERKDQ